MSSFGQRLGASTPAHTAPGTAEGSAQVGRASRREDFPLLEVRPGGLAERFARAVGHRHPAAVFALAVVAGLLVLSALSILLGLFVMHVLLDGLGLASADNSVNTTLADHRTGTLTDLSWVGSFVGGAPLLPALVALIGLGFAIARRWLAAAFAVFALVTESATYRITTIFIHRDRPGVQRLDKLPLDASFPSGHTAASVAVYSGLVLLLTSRVTSSTSKALAWTLAILLTTWVALSRMYRGMHHPLDVAGGVLVGVGAILVMLFACRAAAAASRARSAA